MARTAEIIDQRRFTVDEYHRMAESGIFKPNERVELIRGVVRRMSPKNDPHVVTVAKVLRLLTWVVNLVARELMVFRGLEDGGYRKRSSLRAGDLVAPEAWPDVEIEVGELFPVEEPS